MRRGGRVGGRYRLTRGPLRGGSGEVWLAHDDVLGRDVVLKRVVGAAPDAPGFDRLRAEARVLARFSHPHVVTLHDAVRAGKGARATSWLVMEYVPGGSLDERPCLGVQSAAHIGAQIADALVALHREGIVHADIKPSNVVVAPDGTAKLADFGAAHRVGGKETITPNSAVSYTPDYAAPEVVMGRPEPASDVFSLAATVHALVTGHPPRPGATAAGAAADTPDGYLAARRAARGDVELAPDIDALSADEAGSSDAPGAPRPSLRDTLAAMLARDPATRPDASAARELLRAAAGPPAELPPLPDPLPPERTGSDSAPWPPSADEGDDHDDGAPHPARRAAALIRRHRVPAAVTVLALLAAGAGAGLALHGGGHHAPQVTADARPPASTAPRATPTAARPGSASPLGDHRTADPCALLDPAALRRYGDPELDPAYGGFERCDVIVHPRTGTGTGSGGGSSSSGSDAGDIDVEVQFASGPGSSDLPAPVRGTSRVRLVQERPDGGECDRDLLFPGDRSAHVDITAQPADSNQPPDALLCAIADTAAATAYSTLDALAPGGSLPRRAPALPAGSLARTDACTLLAPHVLQAVPGIDADHPDIGYGNWACAWRSTTTDLDVRLRYDRGQPPSSGDASATRLGGLPAYVFPPGEEGDHTSLIVLVDRTYTGSGGDPLAETVRVLVAGASRTDAQLRTLAEELATAVARQLHP